MAQWHSQGHRATRSCRDRGVFVGKALAELYAMTPTIILSAGRTVTSVARSVSYALEDFGRLEPTKYALGHWLYGAYRAALVGHASQPFSLRIATDVGLAIRDAQNALRRASVAACAADDRFIGALPPRVHVVRIRDDQGTDGFAPMDVPAASLAARTLSLLLADYLTHPERYADGHRAAS